MSFLEPLISVQWLLGYANETKLKIILSKIKKSVDG